MVRILLLGLLLFSFVGCENLQQQVIDLNVEVLEAHDSSMVKMDAIYAKVSALRKVEKRLSADSINPQDDLKSEILAALAQLQSADDAMMDWMADYKAPEKDADPKPTLEYLHQQMESIRSVDAEMDGSIEEANRILEKANGK